MMSLRRDCFNGLFDGIVRTRNAIEAMQTWETSSHCLRPRKLCDSEGTTEDVDTSVS
jgi:hypothetical protein